jgi:hypothetical protein
MAIIAENNGGNYEIMEAGNYLARCYQMIQIGTVEEEFQGKKKQTPKVMLSFEFPTEQKVFKEENGMQPYSLSKEFSLYMNDKANLRKFLESWRGKAFTEEQSAKFDITVLIGIPCMVNVIHKENSKGNIRANIGSISPLMKGLECPPQINPSLILSYDNFNHEAYSKLPEFLREKIASSKEYKQLTALPTNADANEDDLPW